MAKRINNILESTNPFRVEEGEKKEDQDHVNRLILIFLFLLFNRERDYNHLSLPLDLLDLLVSFNLLELLDLYCFFLLNPLSRVPGTFELLKFCKNVSSIK